MTEWRSLLETCAVALMGVALFYLCHIPLPWLLGSLTAVTVWSMLTKRTLYWPYSLRQVALILMGYLLGTSFTEDTLLQMGEHIPSMLFMTVMTILFSLLLGYGVSKCADLDVSSCIIGSVPGGLSQMMVLSEEIEGINPTIVAFMQTIRVMAVIFIVPLLTVFALSGDESVASVEMGGPESLTLAGIPWYTYALYPILMIAGAAVASRVRLPTAYLTGPLIVTVVLMLTGMPTPQLPDFLVTVAQFLIGTHMGLQVKPTELHNWKKVTLYTIVTSVVLVLFAIGLGYTLTRWHQLDLSTAFLGTAPGGMAEMGVTAAVVGADLSVVSSYQLFRLLTIMFILPYLLRWLVKVLHK